MAAIEGGAATDPAAGELLQPLSAEDQSILALESETLAGHTCKVMVLAERVDAYRLREALAARLHRVPELSMSLCEADGQLCWRTGVQPDLDEHLVTAKTDRPVDPFELRSLVARLFEERLNRERPLWRIDLVPEVAGAGSALILRLHHALADGMTAMKIARAALWDSSSAEASAAADPSRPSHPPAGPPQADRLDGLRATLREAPRPWLRSPFDGHITDRRSVAFVSLRLDAIRAIAAAHDQATVNDAVLAVVAGGVRRWLELHHGRLGSVRVKVPVSLHAGYGLTSDQGAHGDTPRDPGNRDSFFCLDLPLGIADPLERLAAIHHATKVRKDGHDAQRLDALMRELEAVPRLRRFAERVLAHPRSFALNVSNVPGPREPVQVLGSRLMALYTLAEIREHHVLRVAVTSVGSTLSFGLVADPTLLPDVERLASLMHDEAQELVSMAAER